MNLRSLFTLTACAAVGLMLGSPSLLPRVLPSTLSSSIFPGQTEPGIDWTLIVLGTLSAAFIVGLVAEARGLSSRIVPREFRFAKRWAVVSRALLAGSLTLCLLGVLAERLDSPLVENLCDISGLWGFYSLIEAAWWISMVLALIQMKQRPGPDQGWVTVAAVVALLLFATTYTLDVTMIHMLVLVAIQGIEASHPAVFHREHFSEAQLIWIGWAGVCSLVAYCLGLALLLARRLRVVATVFAFVPSAAFCCWYYAYGLKAISPEMAESYSSRHVEVWCFAVLLGLTLISIVAWRMALTRTRDEPSTTLTLPASLHRSLPILFLMLVGVVAGGVAQISIAFLVEPWHPYITNTLLLICGYMFHSEDGILAVAIWLGIAGYAYTRIRHPDRVNQLKLLPVSGTTYATYWALMAVVVPLGAALIPAACFCFWLTPWYR